MNNILFTHSYFLKLDPKQWATGQPYPPLGTLYAAALMRKNGYTVSLFDTMFAGSPHEVNAALNQQSPDFFVLYDDGFNYLTKMCLTNMREAAFTMIQLAKAKGCIVIVSGSDATDHYEKYLQQGADFVLSGEAELTLLELIQTIRVGHLLEVAHPSGITLEGDPPCKPGSTDFNNIQGLTFIQNEQVIKTTRRTVLKDLDSLPFPAWDLVNIDPYRSMWLKSSGYFSLNMATTRGCPFKCNWCAKPIYGNRYNSRSPENVVQELKELKARYQFDHIWFCDDIFGLKPGWVNAFADCAEKAQLHFGFKIQARADLLLQENYIKDLARAGCRTIWMGAESGSQKILDAMDKGITVAQIYQATKLLKKHGIHPGFFIQFGYPGETREDIEKTIRMIRDLLPYELGISVSYPLPGTVFYERVKADLKEKANWTDSDELMLMFRNTYPPEFYKKLHRYVHKSYREYVALEHIKNIMTHPTSINWKTIKKAVGLAYYVPAAYMAKQKLYAFEKTL